MKRSIFMFLVPLCLAGCNDSQAKVSCSSPETIAALKQVMFNKVRTATADYTPQLATLQTKMEDYQVTNIVTDGGTDRALTCEAHLKVGVAYGVDDNWLYAVKTTDDGQQVVNGEPTD